MTGKLTDALDHKVIWLEPGCERCFDRLPAEGRTWCQDNVYDPCDVCGREPSRYVLTNDPAGRSRIEENRG